MLLLGIDLGTSSIKVSIFDTGDGKTIHSVQVPEEERGIRSIKPGWAEQPPELWWSDVKEAIKKANSSGSYDPQDICAIGVSYQMHGLVIVDKDQKPLRDSIIWCDSRAVGIGEKAFKTIGEEKSLSHLLNSPGNFTASKLAWVKENEPSVFAKIHKLMLPGDFISMKLTGEITSSISSLSEGVFWDFKNDRISNDVMAHFGFDFELLPEIKPVFSEHGKLLSSMAQELGLKTGIPVSYKSGDQPNNALSLNVLQPGEVAANAGTSGVIYGVSEKLFYDPQSRVNTFAHVNYGANQKRYGVLLCINGTGILNRWVKNSFGSGLSYQQMNKEAETVAPGSSGIKVLPFGNGAERILNNRSIAHIHNLDFNAHQNRHVFRAVQEGIACSFRYGLDIMRENGMKPAVIRAGRANMFLSDVFIEAFVNATQVPVELYENDGSAGAAIGAGIGIKLFDEKNAFKHQKPVKFIEPKLISIYEPFYQEWKQVLQKHL